MASSTIVLATPKPRGEGRLWRTCRRHPTIVIGGTILLSMVFIAIFAPLLATVDPQAVSPARRMRWPQERWWFGTDMMGRDVWSRTLYGARISLVVGIGAAILATAGGLLLGLVTGFIRWVDAILMRAMDGLMSIPGVLLAIALMALTQASLQNVIIAISIVELPRVTRLVRGIVLSLREQPFVEAATASGTGLARTLFKHILPNTLAPLLVQGTFVCASAMITEAILSFIGAGTPPNIPSWGNIMSEARSIFQVGWYIVLFPAVFLSITVLGVNLLGDGLRDMLDPRLSRRL